MKWGVLSAPSENLSKIVGLARQAELRGFSHFWVADYYNQYNSFVVLSMIAAATKYMKLGPAVVNPFTVHPAVLASSIATIDKVSEGRSALGIAAGDPMTLRKIGINRERDLLSIKEAILILRGLLSGETVSYHGKRFECDGAKLKIVPDHMIPIYLGARGPLMLRLSGEIADGTLMSLSNPNDIRYSVEFVEEGLTNAKKESCEIVVIPTVCICDDGSNAHELVKPLVMKIALNSYPSFLRRHRIERDVELLRERVESKEGMESVLGQVTEEMINVFSIAGTSKYVKKVITEISEIQGLNQIAFNLYGDVDKTFNELIKIIRLVSI